MFYKFDNNAATFKLSFWITISWRFIVLNRVICPINLYKYNNNGSSNVEPNLTIYVIGVKKLLFGPT